MDRPFRVTDLTTILLLLFYSSSQSFNVVPKDLDLGHFVPMLQLPPQMF